MEKSILNEQSLSITTEMINQAKSNYSSGGSFHFLLWGWVGTLTNIGFYVLIQLGIENAYYIWFTTVIAGIISFMVEFRRRSKQLSSSHFDRLYGQIWVAAGIGMIVTLISMSQINFNHNAIILIIAGMATYTSGQLMKFRPLITGSLVLFIAGGIAFNLSVPDQSIAAGIAIGLGYLLPGYLLKNREGE